MVPGCAYHVGAAVAAVLDFCTADAGFGEARAVDKGGSGLAGRVAKDPDCGLKTKRFVGFAESPGLSHAADQGGGRIRFEIELDPEDDRLVEVTGVIAEGQFVAAANLLGSGIGEDGDFADTGSDLFRTRSPTLHRTLSRRPCRECRPRFRARGGRPGRKKATSSKSAPPPPARTVRPDPSTKANAGPESRTTAPGIASSRNQKIKTAPQHSEEESGGSDSM